MGDISNNCVLQGASQVPCKRIFCNIEFFIKSILFKEIIRFVRTLVTHPVYDGKIVKILKKINCLV